MKKITLNKICAIRNGYAFKSSEFVENGLPIVRIGEIKNGKVDLSKPKYILPNDKFESYIIRRDDILIAMSGATIGKIGKYNLDIPAYQNQRVGCFLPDKSKLYNDYLYQYLSFISAKIIQNAYGGAQPNISSKELGKTLIPIPSLENQKRIAKVLSNCENLIKKKKRKY
ncbi:restriction endonuclease subunit S [Gillisia marina]|uniref:restriction endonuclease subunit S n=1 Tax=Gillisia marina TaxID=1167637 RepID=UPI000299E202|nr:restriction endonuclease subunit S [Gillisia marina]